MGAVHCAGGYTSDGAPVVAPGLARTGRTGRFTLPSDRGWKTLIQLTHSPNGSTCQLILVNEVLKFETPARPIQFRRLSNR
jgi:hypothetical protein